MAERSFEKLVSEANEHPVKGWDFSWLDGRMRTSPLPWSFGEIVAERVRHSPDLLDIDTGGGERLAALPYRPRRTVATEAWEPNVAVAKARLDPLGVEVVAVESAPGNPVPDGATWTLPFEDGSFHLIVNRHGSYVPKEIARLLAARGAFVTQQIDEGSYDDFYRLLGLAVPRRLARPWNLASAIEELSAARLSVERQQSSEETHSFSDVGAFVWYLRMVSWIVPGFSTSRFEKQLKDLHARCVSGQPIIARQYRFLLEATK